MRVTCESEALTRLRPRATRPRPGLGLWNLPQKLATRELGTRRPGAPVPTTTVNKNSSGAYESKVYTVTGTSLARILQPLARRHHGPNSQSTLLVFHPERSLFSPPSPYLRVPAAQCVLSTLAPICHQLLIIRSCVFCVYCSTMCGVCHQDPCRCKVGRVAVLLYGLP